MRAVGGLHGDIISVAGGAALEVDLGGIGNRDHAGRGVDGKTAAGSVADQRIGGRRSARIGCGSGDADRRAGGGAFRHAVGGAIGVDRGRHRDVADIDGEGLRTGQRAVAGLHGDGISMPGRTLEIDLAAVRDGDHAGGGIDGEAAARGVADQRISNRPAVDVGGGRGDADGGAVRGAFQHGVGGGIGIDRRRGRHIVDADRKGLLAAEVIIFGSEHGDGVGVTWRALEVDLAGVGDRHHAGVWIDLETAAGTVGAQRIVKPRIAVGKSRVRCNTDRRIDRRTFRNGIRSVVGVLRNGDFAQHCFCDCVTESHNEPPQDHVLDRAHLAEINKPKHDKFRNLV